MKLKPLFACHRRARAGRHRAGPDQMGHADALFGRRVPHHQRAPVRRGREEGHRRPGRHQRALERLADQAPGHPARGIDGPGARSASSCSASSATRSRCSTPTTCPSSPPATTTPGSSTRRRSPSCRRSSRARGLVLLYSVAWPGQGLYTKNPLKSVDDLKGTKFRTYSPLHRAPGGAARREPDGDPGARSAAGLRHRHHQRDDHLLGHRHLDQGLGVRQELLHHQRDAPEERGGREQPRVPGPDRSAEEGASPTRPRRPRSAAGSCRASASPTPTRCSPTTA